MRLPDRFDVSFLWALLCLIGTICVAGAGCGKSSGDSPGGQSGASQTRQIVALGRLEPATGIISISAIPGQRLQSLKDGVVEGTTISLPAGSQNSQADDLSSKKTDPYLLGHLVSYDIRKAQLEALDTKKNLVKHKQASQVRLAEVQQSQTEAACLQAEAKKVEIEARRGRLANLQRAAELAHQEFLEMENLREKDSELVTQHQLNRHENQSERAQIEYDALNDSFQPALDAAHAACVAAQKNKEVAKENLEQLKSIGTFEIEVLDKEIELAKKTLALSELRLPRMDGKANQFTILKIFLRPGEFVTQTPIMKVGDLTKMVCIAEVYEADTKEIGEGQTVRIFSSAFTDKFARKTGDENDSDKGGIQGTVLRVSSIITSPGLSYRNPLAPGDRSVVEVLIKIDPKANAEAAKQVGLQVTVEFD